MEPTGCTRDDDLVADTSNLKDFLKKLYESFEDLVYDLYSVVAAFYVNEGIKKDAIKKLPVKVFEFADTMKSMDLARAVSEYAFQKYKMGSPLDEREISCYTKDVFDTSGKEHAIQEFKTFMHVYEKMKSENPAEFKKEIDGLEDKLKSIIRKTKRHVNALKKLLEKREIVDKIGIDGLSDDMVSWVENLGVFIEFAENPKKEMA